MGSPQFMEIMNECLEDQNPLALYSVGQALRNHGLGFIGAAFKQAITERMICRDCIELIVLDDLCYCQDSKTKCHHGTTCCKKRKIVAHGWPNFASAYHPQEEQPIAFAVVEPAVLPKFGEVLKTNKCEGLAEMMEQLNANAAAANGGLSEENTDLLASINKDLEDVGLHNMMDAFNGAMGSKFICNKCKKQLELDDICYCDDAKTKCHCNSRTCCTVTQEERGKST
ncbi:hypothetical protein GPALN_011580 [Globodera pallida]|nr:hypothetical protein GPALN_011580 [Globodera pallida]